MFANFLNDQMLNNIIAAFASLCVMLVILIYVHWGIWFPSKVVAIYNIYGLPYHYLVHRNGKVTRRDEDGDETSTGFTLANLRKLSEAGRAWWLRSEEFYPESYMVYAQGGQVVGKVDAYDLHGALILAYAKFGTTSVTVAKQRPAEPFK